MLLPSEFEVGEVSVIKGYLLLLKNYIVRVASLSDDFIYVYSNNNNLEGTFSLFKFGVNGIEKFLLVLTSACRCNNFITRYSCKVISEESNSLKSQCLKWKVPDISDDAFCNVENKSLMYTYEFQRKF